MVKLRRPFVTAGLTALLLFGALRTELDLHTAHVAVAPLLQHSVPVAKGPAKPVPHLPGPHVRPAATHARRHHATPSTVAGGSVASGVSQPASGPG